MGMIEIKPRHVGVGTFRSNHLMYENLTKVLDTGRISYGPFSAEFEDKFAKLHDCKFAILSNSGTSALEVALKALKDVHGWDDGDEVIVPATTFVATSNIVLHNNLVPVFVDIEADTYGLDPNLIWEAITPRTRCIIAVHLFGQPCKMSQIMEVARKHDLKVIEDSAESMFVTHKNEKVGSIGDIGCFSTYVAHILVTGVGGISTTNNPAYAAVMRSLVNHGLELENLNPDENFRPRPAVGRRFRFERVGFSYRVTEMEAAIGVAQLDTWKQDIGMRRRNARHLGAGLKIINDHYDQPIVIPETHLDNTHSWMMYPIVLRKTVTAYGVILHDKEPLMEHLNERQIETRDMLPLVNQPVYDEYFANALDFPVSRWVEKSGFYVGCHQHLESQDIQYVVQEIERYFMEFEDGS